MSWFFGGQNTHIRRHECIDALREIPGGHLIETDGYLRGVPIDDYYDLLAGAKVVPCPSGPEHVDTARPLEALEMGAVPVCDMVKPKPPQFDYWNLVFPGHPFPTIERWNEFPEILARELADWPHNSNRCFAYWQAWKRRTAHRLDDDVRAVSGMPRQLLTPDDQITVIVVSSPIPSHPATAMVEEIVQSVRDQLPRAEILLMCDGVRPEQQDRAGDYAEYLRRVLWLANNQWTNVLPVPMPAWSHQTGMTRAALDLVTTPLVLFVEHDCPLIDEIDWPAICTVVLSGEVNAVRLHHESRFLPDHEHLMVDHDTRWYGNVPLRRTAIWWQRPHVASTRFYRERIMPIFAPEARTMLEDVLYGVVVNDFHEHGAASWFDWRIAIYDPPGENKCRSRHLDGRGDDVKYPMEIVYAGEPPIGAPPPSV